MKVKASPISNCLKLEFPRCRAIVSRGHGQNYKYLSFDSFRINLNHFMNLFKKSSWFCWKSFSLFCHSFWTASRQKQRQNIFYCVLFWLYIFDPRCGSARVKYCWNNSIRMVSLLLFLEKWIAIRLLEYQTVSKEKNAERQTFILGDE